LGFIGSSMVRAADPGRGSAPPRIWRRLACAWNAWVRLRRFSPIRIKRARKPTRLASTGPGNRNVSGLLQAHAVAPRMSSCLPGFRITEFPTRATFRGSPSNGDGFPPNGVGVSEQSTEMPAPPSAARCRRHQARRLLSRGHRLDVRPSPVPVARAIRRQASRRLTYMLPSEDALAVGMLLQKRYGLPRPKTPTHRSWKQRSMLRWSIAAC